LAAVIADELGGRNALHETQAIVSDKMGFLDPPGINDAQPPLLAPPAECYLMVQRGNTWQRIVIQDPPKGPHTSG
jgi:hypothetical protein